MIYAIAAALCIACGLIAWRVPAARVYALGAIGLILTLLGAGKYASALRDRGRDSAASRAVVAEARKEHKIETAARNDRIDAAQARSDERVAIADTEPTLQSVTPADVEERERRRRAMGNFTD